MDIMRQSACLIIFDPITVYSHGFLFNCTTVGQDSNSMTTLTEIFNGWVGARYLSANGPTVAQLGEGVLEPLSLFRHSLFIDLVVSL